MKARTVIRALGFVAATLAAITSVSAKERNMTDTNKSIARRYLDEVWNHGRLAAVDELVAEDYHGRTIASGQPQHDGRDGVRQWVSGLRSTFPDASKVVRSLVAEGDRVIAEVSFSGTHKATGQRVAAEQVYVLTFKDGRIVAESVYFDVGGTFAQFKKN